MTRDSFRISVVIDADQLAYTKIIEMIQGEIDKNKEAAQSQLGNMRSKACALAPTDEPRPHLCYFGTQVLAAAQIKNFAHELRLQNPTFFQKSRLDIQKRNLIRELTGETGHVPPDGAVVRLSNAIID